MPETSNRPLRVFLCHSSNDKPLVRELYQKLCAEDWIKPWLDEEELYPGQDWNLEIEQAVEAADAILVCLSNNSITKEGYVQRELRIVLDYADYKPEGTLYIIPVRLEDCMPPRRLRAWQYADYFPEEGRERAFRRLLVSLKRRTDRLGLKFEITTPKKESKTQRKPIQEKKPVIKKQEAPATKAETKLTSQASREKETAVGKERSVAVVTLPPAVVRDAIPHHEKKLTLSNGMEFMREPAGSFLMGSTKENKMAVDDERPQHTVDVPYDYWMARFPITNERYNAYVKAKRIKHPVGGWGKKKDHPVVSVSWNDAMAYCQWLNNLLKGELPSGLVLRLPTEAEWEKAARWKPSPVRAERSPSAVEAGSEQGEGEALEWPWGNEFDKNKCNSSEGGKGGTTPVGLYSPQGDSPYGCADMAGNVWEWTHSLFKPYPYKSDDGRENEKSEDLRVLRGGAFVVNEGFVRCAYRGRDGPDYVWNDLGFRVLVSPRGAERSEA